MGLTDVKFRKEVNRIVFYRYAKPKQEIAYIIDGTKLII